MYYVVKGNIHNSTLQVSYSFTALDGSRCVNGCLGNKDLFTRNLMHYIIGTYTTVDTYSEKSNTSTHYHHYKFNKRTQVHTLTYRSLQHTMISTNRYSFFQTATDNLQTIKVLMPPDPLGEHASHAMFIPLTTIKSL